MAKDNNDLLIGGLLVLGAVALTKATQPQPQPQTRLPKAAEGWGWGADQAMLDYRSFMDKKKDENAKRQRTIQDLIQQMEEIQAEQAKIQAELNQPPPQPLPNPALIVDPKKIELALSTELPKIEKVDDPEKILAEEEAEALAKSQAIDDLLAQIQTLQQQQDQLTQEILASRLEKKIGYQDFVTRKEAESSKRQQTIDQLMVQIEEFRKKQEELQKELVSVKESIPSDIEDRIKTYADLFGAEIDQIEEAGTSLFIEDISYPRRRGM